MVDKRSIGDKQNWALVVSWVLIQNNRSTPSVWISQRPLAANEQRHHHIHQVPTVLYVAMRWRWLSAPVGCWRTKATSYGTVGNVTAIVLRYHDYTYYRDKICLLYGITIQQ